jgi:hypothetical protein
VLSCRAPRAPANPNLAACDGGHIDNSCELAVANEGDAVAVALMTGDGHVPGHPEITVPGNTIFGMLRREKPR